MPSLPTKAGHLNPKNFSIQALDYGAVGHKAWKPATQSEPGTWSNIGNRHRFMSEELYSGKIIDDFHFRKNSGELLPYTEYISVRHTVTSTGPSLTVIDLVDEFAKRWISKQSWLDGSNRPMVERNVLFTLAKLNTVNSVLSTLGVDPHSYANRAAAKLYSSGWDGLTFLAELHKVVRMFRGVGEQFIRLIYQYISYRRAFSRKTVLLSFNAWLSGRYGWRVLVFDIQDINHLIRTMDEGQRTRVKERVGEDFSHIDDNSHLEVFANHNNLVEDITSYDVAVRGSVIADFVPNKIRLNPITTAWELVPYSFVVDWLINIGSALDRISFLAINNQYTACTGVKITASREVSYTITNQPGTVINSHNWTGSIKEDWEARWRNPCLISALPTVSLNLDWLKVTDLIALVGQALLKLSRR
jgi:hypothetical protein